MKAVDVELTEKYDKEAPAQTTDKPKSWFEYVDENAGGDWVKFEDGDEKVITVVSKPIGGPIEFKQADGSVKVNDGLQMDVLVDGAKTIKQWTITSKGLMQQLKAACIKEGLQPDITGSVWRVNASGMGLQRKYFLKLLKKPGAE